MSYGTYAAMFLDVETDVRLRAWLEQMGVARSDHSYHCTLVYSKTPVEIPSSLINHFSRPNRTCDPPRQSLIFLGGGLALKAPCVAAYATHYYAQGMGATWDFPELFSPHITLLPKIRMEDLEGKSLWLPHFGITFQHPIVRDLDETGRVLWNP